MYMSETWSENANLWQKSGRQVEFHVLQSLTLKNNQVSPDADGLARRDASRLIAHRAVHKAGRRDCDQQATVVGPLLTNLATIGMQFMQYSSKSRVWGKALGEVAVFLDIGLAKFPYITHVDESFVCQKRAQSVQPFLQNTDLWRTEGKTQGNNYNTTLARRHARKNNKRWACACTCMSQACSSTVSKRLHRSSWFLPRDAMLARY